MWSTTSDGSSLNRVGSSFVFLSFFSFFWDQSHHLKLLLLPAENEWTEDERGEERQLMDELLSIIEQRNQIICSLDQDVQRCGGRGLTG